MNVGVVLKAAISLSILERGQFMFFIEHTVNQYRRCTGTPYRSSLSTWAISVWKR